MSWKIKCSLLCKSAVFLCIGVIGAVYPPNNNNKCGSTETLEYETKCTSCAINMFVDCPDGEEKVTNMSGTPGCRYEQSLGPGPNITKDGCTHTCRKTVDVENCCDGFWGEDCQDCPGGASNACSGYGTCSDGKNGTGVCTCNENRMGYACELCLNNTICAQERDACHNMICPKNADCTVVYKDPICVCRWPHIYTGDDPTFYCTDTRKDVDICSLQPLCHKNATCTKPVNITAKSLLEKCSCDIGFHGDGFQCDPVDPCQVNYGGCNKTSSLCIKIGIGKSMCYCLLGYEKYEPGVGCSMIDMCPTQGQKCHKKAECKTDKPLSVSCTCPDEYEGDGINCYGNILQTVEDLHAGLIDPAMKGELIYMRVALEKFYKDELIHTGPFTMFVPMDSAFRSIGTHYGETWSSDPVKAKQVLRQYMVVGEFILEELLNQTVFYTLQGCQAELFVNNRGSVFRFRIEGSRRKAKIKSKDIIASNGIIHVIDRLMTNDQVVDGDPQKSVLQLIYDRTPYDRMQQILEVAGSDIREKMEKDNVTVFVAKNEVWESLPFGSIDYLKSPEGIYQVNKIMKNLILEGKIEITDLVNTPRIKTFGGTTYDVTVTDAGQIQLNGEFSITHADIVAKNGLLLELDALLVPDGASTLPNFCYEEKQVTVEGVCADCRTDLRCAPGDVKLNVSIECEYQESNRITQKLEKRSGCGLLCNRTFTERQCCPGFYGVDCLPCPGGHKNPCSNHGVCLENGTCQCNANFKGVQCDTCFRDNVFGPNCDQECTCLHGTCDKGTTGTGKCVNGLYCQAGYVGDNCDRHLALCSAYSTSILCHAHAVCVITDTGKRCACKDGYKMRGMDCVEVDPCKEPTRGGCHRQATCTKLGPGKANCSCNFGWIGDGYWCSPLTQCSHHGNCHPNAVCLDVAQGQYFCQCRSDFHGNGSYCVQTDMCMDNAAGCHPKASCVANGPGRAICTCKLDAGYVGDGYSCYGDLLQEIKNNENLSEVASLLEVVAKRSQALLLDANYTIFVPNNQAMREFQQTFNGSLHWYKAESTITMLNYHILMNSTKVEMLAAMDNYTKLETLQDGFSIHIRKEEDGTIVLVSPETGTKATVLERNLMASNGYLNIIDKVLDPYVPTSPDDYPTLDTFFEQYPEYSVFGQWLQEKNVTAKLENDYNAYTLFVPNNNATKNISVTVTTDYLLSYVLPYMKLTASVDDGETVKTALGRDHQLVYKIPSWHKATVNNVPIEKPDIFTFGGIVNGIGGLIYPALHECDETIIPAAVMGACQDCGRQLRCPEGYRIAYTTKTRCDLETIKPFMFSPSLFAYGHNHIGSWMRREYGFNFHHNGPYLVRVVGCKVLCEPTKQITIKGCCSGYYGNKCQECPGGPELPCNGHGTCDDKINGTGNCACQDKFVGASCDSCIAGWTGPNCDIDMAGCGYQNGGCHENALCHRDQNGNISCKCSCGYRGDGYNCTGPCDLDNGGCHDNATCTFKVTEGVNCLCKPGFVGDGKLWCHGDLFNTLMIIEKSKLFLQSLQMESRWFHGVAAEGFKFTVFVPVDSSLSNQTLEPDQLRSQIVRAKQVIELTKDLGDQTVMTLSGKNLTIWYDAKRKTFYVNGTEVVEGNIHYNNGQIHLMAALFSTPKSSAKSNTPQSGGISAPTLVGVGVALLLVAALVVAVVVIYRRSRFRYWEIMQNWGKQRKDSENSSLESPLTFNNHDDDDGTCGLPGNTDFGNPLYKSEDLE